MHHSLAVTSLAAAGLALQAAAADSPGCGTDPTLGSGVNSLDVNGQPREYIIQPPENYDASIPHKLVIGYHWRDGTMDNVVEGGFYGLSYLAADVPTIFVAPQGLDNGWANTNGDDIAFTDQLLEAVESSYCIDQERRFATGWSWGGGMSYSVACSRADVFRAVAVLSGAEISGCDGGDLPIAYFGQHGISDSVLGIELGRTLRDHYVEVNGCDPATPEEPRRAVECIPSRITRIAPQGTLSSGWRLMVIIYRILQMRVLPTRLPVGLFGILSLSFR